MLHRHKWLIINHFETQSQAEILSSLGLSPNTHTSLIKKYVMDLECEKCGKLKRKVIKNAN
jgi:hypothetical protein